MASGVSALRASGGWSEIWRSVGWSQWPAEGKGIRREGERKRERESGTKTQLTGFAREQSM